MKSIIQWGVFKTRSGKLDGCYAPLSSCQTCRKIGVRLELNINIKNIRTLSVLKKREREEISSI